MRSLALLALLGFGSQYPIPEWHQCRKLQPELTGSSHQTGHQKGLESENSSTTATSHASHAPTPEASHKPAANDKKTASVSTPPCHGSSASSEESSGHDHEACPVCQGYLLLGLIDFQQPGPALVALQENSSHTTILSTSSSYSHTRIREILARPPPQLS